MDVKDELRWSDEEISLRKFHEKYGRSLPVILMTTAGYSDEDNINDISADEVYFVYGMIRQKRIIAKSEDERYVSIPYNYRLKFQRLTSRTGPPSDPMTLDDMLIYGASGQRIRLETDDTVMFEFSADRSGTSKLGLLEVLDTYEEKYFLARPLLEGKTLDQTVIGVPVYLPITLRVAEGFKAPRTQESFSSWMQKSSKLLKSVDDESNNISVTCREILVFDHPPSGDYAYINPSKYARLNDVASVNKVQIDDRTRRSSVSDDDSDPYEEIVDVYEQHAPVTHQAKQSPALETSSAPSYVDRTHVLPPPRRENAQTKEQWNPRKPNQYLYNSNTLPHKTKSNWSDLPPPPQRSNSLSDDDHDYEEPVSDICPAVAHPSAKGRFHDTPDSTRRPAKEPPKPLSQSPFCYAVPQKDKHSNKPLGRPPAPTRSDVDTKTSCSTSSRPNGGQQASAPPPRPKKVSPNTPASVPLLIRPVPPVPSDRQKPTVKPTDKVAPVSEIYELTGPASKTTPAVPAARRFVNPSEGIPPQTDRGGLSTTSKPWKQQTAENPTSSSKTVKASTASAAAGAPVAAAAAAAQNRDVSMAKSSAPVMRVVPVSQPPSTPPDPQLKNKARTSCGDEIGWSRPQDIPTDMENFSVDQVALCLEMLSMVDLATEFRKQLVDGQILLQVINEDVLVKDFGCKVFDAKKLIMFAKGWRPKKKDAG